MTYPLTPGCCSAISPCSHQRDDPTTICDICRQGHESYVARERARMLTPGLREAVRIIKGVNRDWPCSLPPSDAERYANEFAMRIERAITSLTSQYPLGEK